MTDPRSDGFRPAEVSGTSPLFRWPPQPVAALKFLFGFPGIWLPWHAGFVLLTLVYAALLIPAQTERTHLSAQWSLVVLLANVGVLVAFVSAWHVPLYGRRIQGTDYKYDPEWPAQDARRFLFGSQVWDNVFWNIGSAVPLLTAYQLVTLWLQANGIGFARTVSWVEHPVYCAALLLLSPLWESVHFYFTHRLLHWKPLYGAVHYLHHKNSNPCPWSGLAMHPAEHAIYFSALFIYWVVPASPFHVLYLSLVMLLGPSVGHLGFEQISYGKNKSKRFSCGDYVHYLHHRYVNGNYGTTIVPLDSWFGSFIDGSEASKQMLKQRALERARSSLSRD